MKYTVLQSYTGHYSERHDLQLSAGQEIELEPMVAEWVNRDRPGTLEEWTEIDQDIANLENATAALEKAENVRRNDEDGPETETDED